MAVMRERWEMDLPYASPLAAYACDQLPPLKIVYHHAGKPIQSAIAIFAYVPSLCKTNNRDQNCRKLKRCFQKEIKNGMNLLAI